MSLEISSVLRFLYDQKFYQSFLALELESKCFLKDYQPNIQFMYKLFTQGNFLEFNQVIAPIKEHSFDLYDEIKSFVDIQEIFEKIEACTLDLNEMIKDTEDYDKDYIEKIYLGLKQTQKSHFQEWNV